MDQHVVGQAGRHFAGIFGVDLLDQAFHDPALQFGRLLPGSLLDHGQDTGELDLFLLFRHLLPFGGRRSPADGVNKCKGVLKAYFADHVDGVIHIRRRLIRESDDNVRGQGRVRNLRPDMLRQGQEFLFGIAAVHLLQDRRGPGLQGHMQVAGNIGMAFDDLDDVLGKITGIRGHEAQTAQPFDLGGRFQQIREIGAVLQVPAVGIDILAQQHDLLHAVPDQPAAFVQDLFFAPAPLPSPDIGHDAVGAELIAAVHDIDAGLVGIFAVIGQVFHDTFRLIPDIHIAAVALQGITEIFREAEQIVGAEDQVHERIGPVDLLHIGGLLHHTAADADLHHGI